MRTLYKHRHIGFTAGFIAALALLFMGLHYVFVAVIILFIAFAHYFAVKPVPELPAFILGAVVAKCIFVLFVTL